MKNKIITWALKGFGTLSRKVGVLVVGMLVNYGFVITKDMEDKIVAVVSFFVMALAELIVFKWRTRQGKNIQIAVGAKKIDGVPLEDTAKQVRRKVQLHGGRPI